MREKHVYAGFEIDVSSLRSALRIVSHLLEALSTARDEAITKFLVILLCIEFDTVLISLFRLLVSRIRFGGLLRVRGFLATRIYYELAKARHDKHGSLYEALHSSTSSANVQLPSKTSDVVASSAPPPNSMDLDAARDGDV